MKYPRVIRQEASLNFASLIVFFTESLVLDYLLYPSTQSNKLHQPQSRAEHTDFTTL